MLDQQRFQNADLVLRVSPNVDPRRFDPDTYEPFLDALCGTREYQKEATRVTLRYLLGGRYAALRELAEENFHSNAALQRRYTTAHNMQRALQLPDHLSCSIDLATATGKSYVIYALARIMLARGAVDRVLILCPSLTIERGLTDKFRQLSSDEDLKALLPEQARVRNPHIGNASETIVDGMICVENFHATLEHVRSSVRSSLAGRGEWTLVINDEAHHVYSPTGSELRRWKEFLLAPEFGFRYVVGLSGTCYIGDDYFTDVIARYSLREAIEQGYAKAIDYVAEDSSGSQDERFQKIYENHRQNKASYRSVKPLTILVTRDIAGCRDLADALVGFLARQEGVSVESAARRVLVVTSAREHAANVRWLGEVDSADNPVEWIVSVSMLTEGWDVQNVFQIVPHEQRAFNSKLLIAQVLGRGLRIPAAYRGERPVVTVFNHDAWSHRIKHLVDEVLEIEKRVYSYPAIKSPDYNFTLHQVNYAKTQTVETFEQRGEYEFTKGYITLVSQVTELPRETTYVRAVTGRATQRQTRVRYAMFALDEVAEHIQAKLRAIDIEKGTAYAEKYSFDWLRGVIRESLQRVGEHRELVSEENRQRLQKAFGVVHREASQTVRHQMSPQAVVLVPTADRRRDSVGVGALRHGDATVFYDEHALAVSDEETRAVLQAVLDDESLPRSAVERVDNSFLFKTPLNVVLTNHRPERDFVRRLVRSENAAVIDGWIKSTDQDFYSIEYTWRKGEHPQRRFFNPDFFIKMGDHVLVVEIKGDEEIADPSVENRGKYRAARQHFATLNAQLVSQGQGAMYHFHFLTPTDYDAFFQFVRGGNYDFVSKLDAALGENGS